MGAFIFKSVYAQVLAILDQIKRLEGSEFPYQHSKDALTEIRILFEEHLQNLNSYSSFTDPKIVECGCKDAFLNVEESLEVLGFILRSTNVRNAFEVYGPLLRIARQVLGADTKLMISSEWSFSPFTFIGYGPLYGYVLIGLPATDSDNPFLVPLAGHELGHTVWGAAACKAVYQKTLEEKVLEIIKSRWSEYNQIFPQYNESNIDTDLFARQTWQPSLKWAFHQAEELFCDFIGLRVFGEAYFYAFSYLLAPLKERNRSSFYPNNTTRANMLFEAAREYNLDLPKDFKSLFTDFREPGNDQRQNKFLLSVADEARSTIQKDLIKHAKDILNDANVPVQTETGIARCLKFFKMSVPSHDADCIASILNAAWKAKLDESFPVHDDVLKELVLKSVEVFEIERRLEENAS